MIMREKPIRGQKMTTKDGRTVKILESTGTTVRVINENGLIEQIEKNYLNLRQIDTKDYEKQ